MDVRKVTFLKKLRTDYNWGSLAVIQFGIFCLLFKNMMIEIQGPAEITPTF